MSMNPGPAMPGSSTPNEAPGSTRRPLIAPPWGSADEPGADDIAALTDAPTLPFMQFWERTRDAAFQPGFVRLAHADDRLFVFAELSDARIHSPAARFNDPLRKQGDFFEILLRPCGQQSYYELHITPTGCRSQFRFADLDYVRRLRAENPDADITPRLRYDAPVFDAAVSVDEPAGRWRVLAAVHLPRLIDQPDRFPEVAHGPITRRWRAAFCRWDMHPDTGHVVQSATAPFPAHNYHLHPAWHRLTLALAAPPNPSSVRPA